MSWHPEQVGGAQTTHCGKGSVKAPLSLAVCFVQAVENRLDPVIGRSREVARVMQILARRRKNNPILLGEPGVGKTAIAEGLALAIVNGKADEGTELPLFLKGVPGGDDSAGDCWPSRFAYAQSEPQGRGYPHGHKPCAASPYYLSS